MKTHQGTAPHRGTPRGVPGGARPAAVITVCARPLRRDSICRASSISLRLAEDVLLQDNDRIGAEHDRRGALLGDVLGFGVCYPPGIDPGHFHRARRFHRYCAGRTVNGMASCASNSRRRGEAEARMSSAGEGAWTSGEATIAGASLRAAYIITRHHIVRQHVQRLERWRGGKAIQALLRLCDLLLRPGHGEL